MAVAIVSETGMAIHIPFKAYIRGKIVVTESGI